MKKVTLKIVLAIVVITLLSVLLYGCYSSNQKLAKKMIEKYSDNQNYITLSGEVIEFNDNNIKIKCEELNTYISYEDEICDYYICSDKIIDLCVGDQIYFVTVPFHFYNGHKLPIVEIKKDSNILLTFEKGKENLIDWVNTNFN